MRIRKNTKGITLISLVITIIIIIILASVATYSGIKVVNSSKLAAFTTELKIMQTQVNKLYDERTDDEETIDGLGKEISTVQTQADKVFAAIANEIDNRAGYRYYDQETIKNLGIEGVEGEFFVNVQKRSVVSYEGLKYEGNTYYTLNQLPDSLYNVEYQASQEQPDFDVDYELLENGRYKIKISNINYNGNINKWQLKYKKENEDDWKTTNNYSFTIDEVGNYRVKIANNNTESREKQIVVDDYQQVEYIESTGTQYIDTGIKCSQNMSCEIENNFNELSGTQLFGAYSSPKRTHYGIVNDKIYMPSVENSATTEHIFLTDINYHTFFLSSTVYKYDNEIIANGMFEFTNGLNFYLFARNKNGTVSNYCKSKMTKAMFWINNELIKNFIPCYRKSDNKPGLYDLVNNEFYTNQGTGNFEIGKDIDSGETINTIIINNL